MNIELRRVRLPEVEALRNLFEKYAYEFSQYNNLDVNESGLYDSEDLDKYCSENDRWAFFIVVGERLADLVLVNTFPEAKKEFTDYTMAEFFVIHKYRRTGVGKYAATRVFDIFHGRWQLMRHPKNTDAVHFWNHVIGEYTKGNYRLVESYPGTDYADGSLGDIYFFET